MCVLLEQWVPEGATVNQNYFKQVAITLRERGESWVNGFILHQDNAPAHSTLPINQVLPK